MTLKEFYEKTGGSLEETMGRMEREDLIRRFLKIFRRGQEFERLSAAMDAGDDAEAFEAVHALKGNALNVGLGDLGRAAAALTEALRHGRTPEAEELFDRVREAYETAVHGLEELD